MKSLLKELVTQLQNVPDPYNYNSLVFVPGAAVGLHLLDMTGRADVGRVMIHKS